VITCCITLRLYGFVTQGSHAYTEVTMAVLALDGEMMYMLLFVNRVDKPIVKMACHMLFVCSCHS